MQNDEAPNDPPAPEPSQSTGINAEAGRDFNVGRDFTGRDKIEINIILNQPPSSASDSLTSSSVALNATNQQSFDFAQDKSKIINSQSRANPFFPAGRINDPHLFFGRERLVREIKAELSKHSSVALAGESQIGKSSLLYYLYVTRAVWLPDVTVEHVDLQSVLDEGDFCQTVLQKLGALGDSLRDLKRALETRTVILFFDEVERLAEPDFNPRLHDLLRSLAQEKEKLTLCLATQHPLEEVFPARASSGVSPFHNIFTRKTLGPFTEAEARSFLDARLSGTGIVFDVPEIERLWIESMGHPAKLQRLAKELFEGKASADTQRISG